MPAQTGVGVDGYSSSVSAASTQSSSNTSLQDKLLARVAELLDKAGVQVQGSGSLALDLDENGNIEVIGNISNKDEVTAALNGDSKLTTLLNSAASSKNESNSSWEQESYILQISQDAFRASSASQSSASIKSSELYVNTAGKLTDAQKSQVKSSVGDPLKQNDGSLALQKAWQVMQSGQYDTTAGYGRDVDDLIKVQSLMAMGLSNTEASIYDEQGRFIGGKLSESLSDQERGYALQSLLSSFGIIKNDSEKGFEFGKYENDIASLAISARDEASELISNQLEAAGINIEDVAVNISVADDGTLEVTASDNSAKSTVDAQKIQNILNKDPKIMQEIASKMKLSSALMELQSQGERAVASDAVLSLLAEAELGSDLSGLSGSDGKLNTDDDKISSLIGSYDSLVSTKAVHPDVFDQAKGRVTKALSAEAADSINTSLKFSGGELSDDRTGQVAEKSINDAKDAIKEVVRSFNNYSASEDYVRLDGGDTKIQNFEVVIDANGNATFSGGESSNGEKLIGNAKDTAINAALAGITPDAITKLLEQHNSEHGDTNEYAHSIKVTYNNGNIDIEVVSEEADSVAQNELDTSLSSINNELNSYFDTAGIVADINIEADKEGHLVSDSAGLTEAQAKIVKSTLELINSAVDDKVNTESDEDRAEINSIPKMLRNVVSETHNMLGILHKFHDKNNWR